MSEQLPEPPEPGRDSRGGDSAEMPVGTVDTGPRTVIEAVEAVEPPAVGDRGQSPEPAAAAGRGSPADTAVEPLQPGPAAATPDDAPAGAPNESAAAGRWGSTARRARIVSRRATGGLSNLSQSGARKLAAVAGAQGMRESGLTRLFALHVFNAGGDASIAVGLAGTLFFQVPSGEARSRVALYLLLTMAPFALVAPLLGPFLDRFRHGRRWAIGTTMASRAFFCWVLAGAISTGSTWLYPVAFGCLVASKAYGIARASSIPRVLPSQVALVTANSRISLSGMVGAALGGGIAAAVSRIGPEWALRWAFLVFIGGTVLAIRLPAKIDSTEGEAGTRMMLGIFGRSRRRLPHDVLAAMQINTALRAFSGFLIMFLAFMLRERPFPHISHVLMYTLVGAAAGAGSLLGTGLGAVLRARSPRVIVRAVLCLAIVGAATSAILFGPLLVVVAALIGGLCQQLGKLSLDATIQAQVTEEWRTSVFARSETLLQIGWVLGGVLGILLPLWPGIGFTAAAVWMAATGVWLVLGHRRHRPGTIVASA